MKTDPRKLKSLLFAKSSAMAPSLVKSRVFDDTELLQSLGLKAEGIITLGVQGADFKRSALTAAVKKVIDKKASKALLQSQAGVTWTLQRLEVNGKKGLGLTDGKQRLRIDDLALLAGTSAQRLAILANDLNRTNLPPDDLAKWKLELKKAPLSGDDLADLTNDLANTPLSRLGAISGKLDEGGMGTDTLVPRLLRYYERLCGTVGVQANIADYAAEVLRPFIRSLFEWNRIEGAKLALLVASHPAIIPVLEEQGIASSELAELMRWAEKEGDAISRSALVELGLRRPKDKKEIQKPLAKLVVLMADVTKEKVNQYELLTASFAVVYGELGITGVMNGKPVYWKRLAALAQAALICRSVQIQRRDHGKFVTWMTEVRAIQYLLHCYSDYRTAPRWMAEFGLPHQLRNELGGRIFHFAEQNAKNVSALNLSEAILGDGETSLKRQLTPLLTILAGPLEGDIPAILEMKPEEIEQLRRDLIVAAPVVQSFSVLASAVLVAKIPADLPALAAEAIQRAQYKLDKTADRDELGRYVRALAQLSAISRSKELADAIFILIRNYRRNFPDEIGFSEAFSSGIIACGSREDFSEWCKAVGNFVNDFSFGRLNKEEAQGLFSTVLSLCNMVPELWARAGEGLAAIESVAY